MLQLDQTVEQLGCGTVVSLDSGDVLFKLDSYENNPVVTPQEIGLTWRENGELKLGAVFNGGAEVFQDKIMLTPRCHMGYRKGTYFDEVLGIERAFLEDYVSEVWPLVSGDGIHFTRFQHMAIKGNGASHRDFTYGIEDIRIIRTDKRYLLVGCGKTKPPFKGGDADRIAVYSTADFVDITYHGMVESFDSRNAVPFPTSVNGRHYILLRFHPNIHLAVMEAGMEQLMDPSNHRERWGSLHQRRDESLLIEAGHLPHEKEKIGPGPQVVKTDRGRRLVYHAVGEIEDSVCRAYGLSGKIERGYSVCAALLDLNDPKKVLCRTRNPLYIPTGPFEANGDDRYTVDVPMVVFPVGAIVRQGKLLLYAGAGDKYVVLLSCDLDSLVSYMWNHCRVTV